MLTEEKGSSGSAGMLPTVGRRRHHQASRRGRRRSQGQICPTL